MSQNLRSNDAYIRLQLSLPGAPASDALRTLRPLRHFAWRLGHGACPRLESGEIEEERISKVREEDLAKEDPIAEDSTDLPTTD